MQPKCSFYSELCFHQTAAHLSLITLSAGGHTKVALTPELGPADVRRFLTTGHEHMMEEALQLTEQDTHALCPSIALILYCLLGPLLFIYCIIYYLYYYCVLVHLQLVICYSFPFNLWLIVSHHIGPKPQAGLLSFVTCNSESVTNV